MRKTVAHLLAEKGTQVWTVTPDTKVYAALELMAERNLGAVLVLDGDRLAGIMSERDYARKVILVDRDSKETPVGDIMSPEVVTAAPTDTVNDCMRLMTERRIRHLPVLDGGAMAGIVSIGDVVKGVIAEQEFLIEQLESYISG